MHKTCLQNNLPVTHLALIYLVFQQIFLDTGGLDTILNKKDTVCNFHEMYIVQYMCVYACGGVEVGINQIIYSLIELILIKWLQYAAPILCAGNEQSSFP